MPLPPPNTPWPPKPLADITAKLREWDAWYSGDRRRLADVYRGRGAPSVRPSQQAGGVVGKVSRWLWGTPPAGHTRDTRIHVPLASDIAEASADLLLSEPPTLTIDGDPAAQARLDAAMAAGLHTTLVAAAEMGAALGGVYLRASWDQDLNPAASFATIVHADAAWPTFLYGRLRAVTFWRVVADANSIVRRHVETHELDGATGVIHHALYEGTAVNLGRHIPLSSDPTTAPLADGLEPNPTTVTVSTLTPGLDVIYVPNKLPSRSWRHHPIGVDLGRSDLDGIEPILDALDETWTSWMRDIRLGKGRLIAPEQYFKNEGPGRGATFDEDREVWALLQGMTPGRQGEERMKLEAHQFAIRVDEHQRTAAELIRTAVRSAGYSAQTFGEQTGGQQTATEVGSKDRRSETSRGRKIRAFAPAIAALANKMLLIDREVLGQRGFEPALPAVTFSPTSKPTPLEIAQTSALWSQARAASIRTLVELNHPDWDETRIGEEVQRIYVEQNIGTAPDPFQIGTVNDPTVQEDAREPDDSEE